MTVNFALRKDVEQLLTRLAQLPRYELMDSAYIAEIEAFVIRIQANKEKRLQELVKDWRLDAESTHSTNPLYSLARERSAKELSLLLIGFV